MITTRFGRLHHRERRQYRGRLVWLVSAVTVVVGGCGKTTGSSTTSAAPPTAAVATSAASGNELTGAPPAGEGVGDPNATLLSYLEDPRIETEARGSFHTFVHLVQVARLTPILSGPGPMALFVPTDEAFALAFTPAQMAALEAYPIDVARLVNFHAANGIWPLAKVRNGTIPTMEVNELRGAETDGVLRLNGIEVRKAAIPVSNGYIYVMNGVLRPPGFQIASG